MTRFHWKFRRKKSIRREASRGLPVPVPGETVLTADGLPQPEQVVSDRAPRHASPQPGPGAEDEWLDRVRASGL